MTDAHEISFFRNDRIGSDPWSLLDTNLVTGTMTRYVGTLGRPSERVVLLSGKLYGGTSEVGWWWVCDFTGTNVRSIAACPDRDFNEPSIGEDGKIYVGTYPNAHICIYNPADDTLFDCGKGDVGETGAFFSLSIAQLGDFVWLGVGELPYYLIRYQLSTTTYTLYFKGDDRASAVLRTADGTGVYYNRSLADMSHKYYDLSSGTPAEVDVGDVPALEVPYIRSNNVRRILSTDPDYDYDLKDALPYTSHNATIGYKLKADSTYTYKSNANVLLSPCTIKRIADVGDASRLFVETNFYQPLIWWNPSTHLVEVIGTPPYSLYDINSFPDGMITLQGYPSVGLFYDPNSAWTLNAGSPDVTLTNAVMIFQLAKYQFWSTRWNSLIFFGLVHERNSIGGHLVWSASDGIYDHLSAGFENWPCFGLATCGDWIVYSGQYVTTPTDAVLIIIDANTKAISATYTPLTSNLNGAAIVAISSTDVIGIAYVKSGSTITGSKAYRFDVSTGTLIWSVDLPAAAWANLSYYDRRPFWDGMYVYFPIGNAIYRLDTSGTCTKLADTDGQYNVFVKNGIAYTYMGTVIHEYATA